MKSKVLIILVVGVLLSVNSGTQAVTMDWVTVGNAGNANDDTGYGGVSEVYRISKYEVTAGQYCDFLNAVAATDTYGLYKTRMGDISPSSKGCNIQRGGSFGSYTYSVAADWAHRPVNIVSWYDTLRFSNWLHNGQPTGGQINATTEDGAYDMSLGASVVCKAGATVWLPSEDEWYKAAYHKNNGVTGNYFDWQTNCDSKPSNDLIDPDPGNNATFWQDGGYTIGNPYYRTEVGEFENSESPYGTFDQCGNVWEWVEAYGHMWGSSQRVIRGSSWACNNIRTREGALWEYPPASEGWSIGFRVASVPEPCSLVLLSLGGLALRKRRRTK